MVGCGGGDREDGSLGGRVHREYRGGGRGSSGRYRHGFSHHRHVMPGERRGTSEQGHPGEEEVKADQEKIDLVKHRPHKGELKVTELSHLSLT